MKPDEKYMAQSRANLDDNDIKFVPPEFMDRNLYDKVSSNFDDDSNLDLFPSETGFPELCYHSDDSSDYSMDRYINVANNAVPTTFDILRNLDLDLDETEDLERSNSNNDINKIYSKIEKKHPGIFATLYSYRIPRPIVRVIIKRLIKSTLLYSNKDDKC
ncbi:hypothetical protein [uncultured Clostridium sp.]|uniref:hypothetical protein n=1 Tax=uncultured Clostridium sp. TaxID=59620 RepID=UPI0028F12516|nr:hypothetical protein [uncultured Clostridium sp.]